MKFIDKHPLTVILLLYTFANFLMLFNNGVFWDDWCMYNMSYSGIQEIYFGIGLRFMAPITYFLQDLTPYPALLYHFIGFTLEFISVIFFYKILTILISDKIKIFWLTAFFAVVPYYGTKIQMCCIQYTMGFFLFLTASLFFLLFIKRSNLLFRILSLVFFFTSFGFLSSTLVLMPALLLFIAIYPASITLSVPFVKKIIKRLSLWPDFIFLPILYWIFRNIFLKPIGIYADFHYNEVTLRNLIAVPINLLKTTIGSLFGLVYETLHTLFSGTFYFVFFIFLLLVTYFLIRKSFISKINIELPLEWFMTAIYFFIICVFAYNAVDKIPSFFGYETRHQILLRIATPILLVSLLGIVNNGKIQQSISIIILALFIVTGVGMNVKYLSSWFKQVALEQNFQDYREILNRKSFIVMDNTKELNENERGYEFYCFAGILKKVFNDQSRFMITSEELPSIKANFNFYTFTRTDMYNMRTCNFTGIFDGYLFIDYQVKTPSVTQLFCLLMEQYLVPVKYHQKLSGMLNLKYLPIESNPKK